ncbi:MAG: sugar isomerase [Candidatus Marinimicrobia bacterium]|nr:sugar isomerase [Candidatus Neomarinimicrobiota bacterium]|tara:strand:+ start:20095 stop:20709 length:615 start_codon:yes stop_codon:yes gene_type:complete
MNNINTSFNKSKNFSDFAVKYFNYLTKIQKKIDKDELDKFAEEFIHARSKNNTIFITGNGGSAATATTMANDIGFDIIKKTGTDKPFKIFSLTDNNSVITAIANDVGYENIFVNQLKIHYTQGDKLVVISASGNSKNVILAAEWVKSQGGKVMGMLGFDGGELRKICDISILVPTLAGEYGPVEDLHLMINHLLAHWFQGKLKK